MPTYEFRCPAGHEFERFFRKVSDAPGQVECPECGKVAERILSAGAGLLFKGSGFYLTDYGKNAHRKAGGAGEKKGEGKPGEGSSGGGESKPGGSSGGSGGSGSGGSSGSSGSGGSGGSGSSGGTTGGSGSTGSSGKDA